VHEVQRELPQAVASAAEQTAQMMRATFHQALQAQHEQDKAQLQASPVCVCRGGRVLLRRLAAWDPAAQDLGAGGDCVGRRAAPGNFPDLSGAPGHPALPGCLAKDGLWSLQAKVHAHIEELGHALRTAVHDKESWRHRAQRAEQQFASLRAELGAAREAAAKGPRRRAA
jgi:hypothetical protein